MEQWEVQHPPQQDKGSHLSAGMVKHRVTVTCRALQKLEHFRVLVELTAFLLALREREEFDEEILERKRLQAELMAADSV